MGKKLDALTLRELIEEARDWNRADIRGIEDITPDISMLRARARVLKAALKLLSRPGVI